MLFTRILLGLQALILALFGLAYFIRPEQMASLSGMLLMDQLSANKVVYFMALDRVKFRKPVRPGDQLHLDVRVLQIRGNTCRMEGLAKVDGKVVAEGEMMACVMDR